MTLLQHHIVAELITAITTLALGCLVLWCGAKKPLHRSFFYYSLSIAGWGLTEALVIGARDVAAAKFWLRAEIFPVSAIGSLFLHFNYRLSGRVLNGSKKWLLRIAYGTSISFCGLGLLAPELLIKHARATHYLFYFSDPGPLYLIWNLNFLVLVILGNAELLIHYRDSTAEQKKRLKYFVWSTMAGFLGGSPDWLLGYDIYVPGLNPFGIYAVAIYAIVTAYSILQYCLFDIQIVVRRSIIYSLLVTFLTVGYFGLAFGLERAFQITVGYRSPWLSLMAFAMMAFVFQPLKVAVQRFVDYLVFQAPQHAVAKRLEVLEQKVREGEQYKAVATMAAEIAHELKNPLTALQTFVEFLPERYQDSQFRQQFQAVVSGELYRLRRVAQGLLDFSKPQAPQMIEVDLRAVLDDVLALTIPTLLKRAIVVETHYAHNGATIIGDAAHLRQVFLNLVRNADQAMQPGGTLTVSTSSDNGHVEIYVADTGCGIPPGDVPHLFDPFFSKKAEGTGLGLSIAREIIREHHGAIEVQSMPGQGTTMVVRLPAR